jgi:hypothetical protein
VGFNKQWYKVYSFYQKTGIFEELRESIIKNSKSSSVYLSSPPPPFSVLASLLLTIITFCYHITLVYSIHDPTEVAIKKMIEASQRMITINSQGDGVAKDGGAMNPVMKRHLELEIKTLLQNAPRNSEKLERLLQVKER